MFNKKKSFWEIISILDWKYEGEDNRVLAPAVDYLSRQTDEFILGFEEQMAEFLYAIDGKIWAEDYKKAAGIFSDDGFLYCRCVAIINGENYYYSIKNRENQLDGALEFESLLYVPQNAWAKKHNRSTGEYPYITKTSYESGSNKLLWQ